MALTKHSDAGCGCLKPRFNHCAKHLVLNACFNSFFNLIIILIFLAVDFLKPSPIILGTWRVSLT